MDTWIQWLYSYGVGGVFFVATLVLAFRTRAVRWEHPIDRRLVLAIIAGMVSFMTVHAVWIAVAAGTTG